MKRTILFIASCLFAIQAFTQVVKEIPPSNLTPGQEVNLNIRPWFSPRVPSGENPFGVPAPNVKPMTVIPGVKVVLGNEGLPIHFKGIVPGMDLPVAEENATKDALNYLVALQLPEIDDPAAEFTVSKVQKDERRAGTFHVRLQQHFRGVPIFGAELIAHTTNGVFSSAAGRYAPTPELESVEPQIDAESAIQKVISHFGADKVKMDWRPNELELIGGQPFRTELVVYRIKDQNRTPRLAWHIEAHPSIMHRYIYFVDAQTGAILHFYDYTCNIAGHAGKHPKHLDAMPAGQEECEDEARSVALPLLPGPVTGTGTDLAGHNQSFGAWEHTDGTRYMIDAQRAIFNGNSTSVPFGNMHGVIVTKDQNNVNNGPLSHVTSNSNAFGNPTAISAHVNAGICYEYYWDFFSRAGIDGQGGSIISVINVPDDSGPMDNAYWNGNAMFWGNGSLYFTPLAKSLDVAGHEMTHGVVQGTAGLIYEDESGALNESFADIFAAMIDRDDWGIGEGIMLPGVSSTGLLRDLSNPSNGDGDFWQPSHYSELYVGPDDNGGVHGNSGITNYAFYLFASNSSIGKATAENIYYYTLSDRLTASSQFIDLRLAVIDECLEYWDQATADIAAAAFDAVGITSGPPNPLAGTLAPNTGIDHVLSVSDDGMNLTLSEADGTFLEELYTDGVLNRPSITDNGETIVFVNNANQIVGIEIAYNDDGNLSVLSGIVSQDAVWRNVAISKDGRFLAGLTTLNDNKVIFFDLDDPAGPAPREYFLVNPTFVQDVPWVDNVQYADQLEFDYSGTQLIYDAYSEITNAEGEHVGHWDIGLLTFWKDGEYTDNTQPKIRKLIQGLGDNAGVAQPVFSKNANHLIAYDYYIDIPNVGIRYYTYVANIETGDNGPVVVNGHELAYPSFTTRDDKVLFQDRSIFEGNHLRLQELAANQMAPQGNPSNLILGHKWGLWLNNGSRVHTNVDAPGLQPSELVFSAYPNPASGLTRIELSLESAANAQYTVTDMLGKALLQRSLKLASGENRFDIDLQSLPQGIYLLHIQAEGMQGAIKLVKE